MSELHVAYDLRHAPVTFDFGTFLAGADAARQLLHRRGLNVTVITSGFRGHTKRDKETDVAEKQWRIKGILAECCSILPSVTSLTFTTNEPTGIEYPIGYPWTKTPYLPKDSVQHFRSGANVRVFSAPSHALQAAPESDVCLSVRSSTHHIERNVDLTEWYKFYQDLTNEGRKVIVIPDQEDVLGAQKYADYDWNAYLPASFDLRLRYGVYAKTGLNVTTTSGPPGLLFWTDYPVLQFDQLRGGTYGAENIEEMYGIQRGQQFPWSAPDQRLTWCDSTYETLTDEYKKFGELLCPAA